MVLRLDTSPVRDSCVHAEAEWGGSFAPRVGRASSRSIPNRSSQTPFQMRVLEPASRRASSDWILNYMVLHGRSRP